MKLAVFLAFGILALASKWTPDDVLMTESAGDMQLSRDGKFAVWVKSQMDREKGEAVSNIILRYLDSDSEVPLTRGQDTNSSPRFSPDGKRIVFLSSRKTPGEPQPGQTEADHGSQVWMIDIRGGEAWQVTKFERGVRALAWLDSDTLLLAAPEDASLYDQKTKERKDTSMVVDDEDHAPPVRLIRYDIKKSTATRLTDNADRIERISVSPDGLWAVTTHDRSLRYIYDQKVRPATWLHDLKNNRHEQLYPDYKTMVDQVAWSPDSKGFYFTAGYTNHPVYVNASIEQLYYYDLLDRKIFQLPLGWERAVGGGIAATPDGVLALLADGARMKPALFTRVGDSWARDWVTGEHVSNIFGVNVALDGKTVLYQYTTASVPSQWYRASLNRAAIEQPKAITALNESFQKKQIAKSELVHWKGARDEEVEGILSYPHDYQPGKKYALMVMIHGGPHGTDHDSFSERWAYPVQLFAQRGAFVFRPNYHGSSSYGLKWGESISGGNYNELEWIDVEKGVDSLIAKGLVDPDKLGVMGWSNGSIITIELTTRTTRYKAASAGAGDVNWTSDWGNAVFGRSFDDYYFGKSVLEDPQLYIKKSPLFRMDKVRTPTIIFFGTEDKQVPTEQGWQHYRALQQLGNTDVRFILFPGEAHGPRKLVHQRRKVEEELAWFDKYLFKTLPDRNEALKPESPLAAALALKKAGDNPETVQRGDLYIGRFEITRAQFGAFDSAYRFPQGTEDYPATGVTFDRAKAYCEWLSMKSGQKYRLGTEEEMAAQLKPAKSENTLDHWAGYPVNSDDAHKLASLVEGLGPGALLRPVGSFAGNGEEAIYDLGGNAAEWVVTKAGEGKAIGGSADRPADEKSLITPRLDYTGFRVVRDGK
jgi:dipeptidyl aminopeptidase/acylaminoacyl peptidase